MNNRFEPSNFDQWAGMPQCDRDRARKMRRETDDLIRREREKERKEKNDERPERSQRTS